MSSFAYLQPASINEALQMLEGISPRPVVMAGGTDVLVQIKNRLLQPQTVINLKNIQILRELKIEGKFLRIGALITHQELSESELVRYCAPVLAEAASEVGSRQIRNFATIGGNVVNASPAADTVPALLALGARLLLQSVTGKREVAVADFFTGPGRTVLDPQELLTAIRVPAAEPGEGGAFLKMGRRNALAVAVANVAVWLKADPVTKRCLAVRIALGSLGPTVIRARQTETILHRQFLSQGLLAEAAAAATQDIRPIDDLRAGAVYRQEMGVLLTRRALKAAAAQAVGV